MPCLAVPATLAALAALAVLGVLPAGCGGELRPDAARRTDERTGPCAVVRVVDGDTVDVVCDERRARVRVRLLNVDTPERGQPGYDEARRALEALIGGRPVFLVFEQPGQPAYGRYGRLLAYLLDESGRNLNVELVRGGWSPFYRDYGDGRFPQAFRRAEADARARARSGGWRR